MKKSHLFTSLVMVTASSLTFANPQGFQIASGKAAITYPDPSTVQITTGEQTILNWESFSIQEFETTRFVMPSSSAAVLNRVLGGDLSQLLGKLEANGEVFLINPNGILVGDGALINTASFIASSFDILDQSFLKNGELAFTGVGGGSVINLGKIVAKEGDVQLIGSDVQNFGVIEALGRQDVGGRVFLIAEERGVNSSGVIRAQHEEGFGGDVRLLGSQIYLMEGALIDVSGDFGGGEVLIGGDFKGENPAITNAAFSFIDPNVKIIANATLNGDGGRVIVWSDRELPLQVLSMCKEALKGATAVLLKCQVKVIITTEALQMQQPPLEKREPFTWIRPI